MTDHATLKQRAAMLRRNQTPAERKLWSSLRMRNVGGVRFLRQRVIGQFIADFYAPSLRLVVELDGGQHYEPNAQHYDQRRTEWLRTRNIMVLRYSNLEIARNLDDVLSDIERVVARLSRPFGTSPAFPTPSLAKGG